MLYRGSARDVVVALESIKRLAWISFKVMLLQNARFVCDPNDLGWVHTCNVTAYRYTVSWQCGRDSCPRNVSKVGRAVTLWACSVCCLYLAVASKGWYGYGSSRCGRATWRCFVLTNFSDEGKVNLWEPCVLYIGRAYRYLPNVAFCIFFQQL